MWEKLHDENAIEAVAITLTTTEPLGSLPTKRVLRELESATSAAGFHNRAPVQDINVNIDISRGVGVQQNTLGMLFQRTRLARGPDGTVAQVPAQQVQATSRLLSYSTWMYRDWSVERAEALNLFRPVLTTLFESAPVAAIRLEYLDRFFWSETKDTFTLNGFLQEASPFLTPQIFDAPDMFHSHTGRFEEVTDESRILLAVNADLQTAEMPHPRAGHLTLALLSVAEMQFPKGFEATGNLEEFFESKLNVLHDRVIDLFKRLINRDYAAANGLPHD